MGYGTSFHALVLTTTSNRIQYYYCATFQFLLSYLFVKFVNLHFVSVECYLYPTIQLIKPGSIK